MDFGTLGAFILSIALLAAFIVNCTDKRRKSKPPSAIVTKAAAVASKVDAAPTDTRERCTILFGTQTGTAERFAKSLKSQLESKYGASTAFDVIDVEHYTAEDRLHKEKLVFFMLATYGDGEPTDDAAEFYNWLMAKQEEADADDDTASLCDNVHFGVFALGNRQYEHFCAVGKHVHKAMLNLGAKSVVRLGTGDDDDDIDEDFDAWSADLFKDLQSSPLLKAGSGAAATPDSVPAFDIEEIKDAPVQVVDMLADGPGLNHAAPHLGTVTCVRELHTPASDRSCVHVEIDISGGKCKATYEAGDHVAVFAENSPEVVASTAKVLGLPLDYTFAVRSPASNTTGSGTEDLPDFPPFGHASLSNSSSSSSSKKSACVMTLRGALARYVDVLSAPSKAALAALAAFATDPSESSKLSTLASIEGRDAYHTYIVLAKRSLLEVMQEHPTARPTLGAFFASIAPHLQPRFYSISSSSALHPRSVHITCAVVREQMPTGRVHQGVASGWLASATPGTKVPIFLRRSAFKLPAPTPAGTVPIVMIGPGTGLAPFRGFIQELEHRRRSNSSSRINAVHLFFGCRRPDQDYIYQEELESAVETGTLTALHVAFSRQTAVKEYVQHHMTKHGKELWELLGPKGNGYVYVCGDAKHMAKDVHATLVEIAGGEAAVKELAESGRYHKDVW